MPVPVPQDPPAWLQGWRARRAPKTGNLNAPPHEKGVTTVAGTPDSSRWRRSSRTCVWTPVLPCSRNMEAISSGEEPARTSGVSPPSQKDTECSECCGPCLIRPRMARARAFSHFVAIFFQPHIGLLLWCPRPNNEHGEHFKERPRREKLGSCPKSPKILRGTFRNVLKIAVSTLLHR